MNRRLLRTAQILVLVVVGLACSDASRVEKRKIVVSQAFSAWGFVPSKYHDFDGLITYNNALKGAVLVSKGPCESRFSGLPEDSGFTMEGRQFYKVTGFGEGGQFYVNLLGTLDAEYCISVSINGALDDKDESKAVIEELESATRRLIVLWASLAE